MNARLLLTIASIGSVSIFSSSTAADFVSPLAPAVEQVTSESGWTFTVSPYFWIAGLEGDIAQFGLPSARIDADFGDVFDHLDFAAATMAEARYGPWRILGDVMYTKLSGQGGTPRGILAEDVEISSEVFASLMGVGYAVYDDADARLDIVGGVRWLLVPITASLEPVPKTLSAT